MTENTEKEGIPALKIEQVALLCGVSVARVNSWINKKGLNLIESRGEQKIAQEDLVEFLMHYNMPIPSGILPINATKVLFISPEKRGGKTRNTFFRLFSKHFGRKTNCFLDSVAFGKSAEYKILTFLPDLILVDAVHEDEEALNVIRFSKNVGGMRTVALIRRNLVQEKRERLHAAGAHMVLAKNLTWEELVGSFDRVFSSLGKTTQRETQ